MTHDEAFLQAIIESPDDDGLRLIYTDWLEDHGRQEKAAFIRVQCELARLPEDDPRRAELEARERVLLKEHGEKWAGPLRGLVEEWELRRGLIESVTITFQAFPRIADELFALHPIRHIKLSRGDPKPALARCPHLMRLTSLRLRCRIVSNSFAKALAGSPHVAGLRLLELAGCLIHPVASLALQGRFAGRLRPACWDAAHTAFLSE